MTALSTIRRSSPRTASPLAPGFSMVELMIAIMILGVGLVMVATVFPVGLDITRDTLQVGITQSAVDAAVATVQAKVPAYKNLDDTVDFSAATNVILNELKNASYRVVMPDVFQMEWTGTGTIPNIDNTQEEGSANIFPSASVAGWAAWDVVGGGTLNAAELKKARVFTERSAWDAELNAPDDWHKDAFVLPAQNIPADGAFRISTMTVPTFDTGTAFIRNMMLRVHIADMVYPPITLEPAAYPDRYLLPGTSDSIDPLNGDRKGSRNENGYLARLIAEGDPDRGETARRYSWMVIARRAMADRDVRDLMLTVVVLYRGDLSARYARQKGKTDNPYDVMYDLSDSNDVEELLQPVADDDTSTDTRFPQPWLVVLGGDPADSTLGVDPSVGEVRCTAEVAQLLPANSYFVVARTNGDLIAGTAFKVLGSTWDRQDYGDNLSAQAQRPATLRIPRTTGIGLKNNVLAWVFPPPIIARASGSDPPVFGPRSPVAGVALRRVPAP